MQQYLLKDFNKNLIFLQKQIYKIASNEKIMIRLFRYSLVLTNLLLYVVINIWTNLYIEANV